MATSTQSVSNINSDTIRIGEWTFHASLFRLECGHKVIKLEPRVAKLLSCLADNAGTPVSRENLMEKVWPGIVVGDEALTNAINKLRKAFGENRQNPRVIETIPKAGYRLIANVIPVSSAVSRSDEKPVSTTESSVKRRWLKNTLPVILIIALILAAYALWMPFSQDVTSLALPDNQVVFSTKPSIAVLPFENLSQNPEQEYFSDGVTDDIITHLAKNSELRVITRDSSFFYKAESPDLKTIAKKLNVSHILHGSIRRTGEQQVINAQLVNVTNGAHIWAEQYSYKATDLFRVENEIAKSVMTALLNKQQNNSALKPLTMPTRHAQAHDYLLLGRYHFYKFASKKENIKARKLFREAIELDPDYALAYALSGWTYIFEAMNGWSDDRPATLKQAVQLASKAIDMQPELPLSYYVRGLSYREQGDKYVEALGEVETALKFDPNNANANVLLASLLYYAGRPVVGLERIKEAMKINPHHPYNYHFHLGQAYFVLRQYEEAMDAFQQGLASNPAAERLRVWLAATYAQSGDIDSANWEAEQVLSSNPDFSVARMEKSFHFKDPAELKHFTDGLRLAGFK